MAYPVFQNIVRDYSVSGSENRVRTYFYHARQVEPQPLSRPIVNCEQREDVAFIEEQYYLRQLSERDISALKDLNEQLNSWSPRAPQKLRHKIQRLRTTITTAIDVHTTGSGAVVSEFLCITARLQSAGAMAELSQAVAGMTLCSITGSELKILNMVNNPFFSDGTTGCTIVVDGAKKAMLQMVINTCERHPDYQDIVANAGVNSPYEDMQLLGFTGNTQ